MKKHPDWNWSSIFARTFATGGAITLTGFAIAFSGSRALAQVTPALDGLNTQVTPNGQVFEIMGGTPVVRSDGAVNLFHSFGSFMVPSGWTAEFLNNPINVANIFARVTGGTESYIQGIIKAQGHANLFLMNPSGIIFGPHAQLQIGGSFVGTTANAIGFPNGGQFSMNSQVEQDNTLLAVNPNALFFNKTPIGAIINQSIAPNPTKPNLKDGLRVPDGQNLFLVGGNVTLNGGTVRAPGGRIELGGLAEEGVVEIKDFTSARSNPNLNFSVVGGVGLEFPEDVARADVVLTNGAIADVTGENGGDIAINARNIVLSGQQPSNICAGIGSNIDCGGVPGQSAGTFTSRAGNIILNATGDVKLSALSRIANNVNKNATGNSIDIFKAVNDAIKTGDPSVIFGSIFITANSLSVTDGASVSTSTFGNGNAGLVYVDAKDSVLLAGSKPIPNSSDLSRSRLASAVGSSTAQGNAGGILIRTGSLSLTDYALINSSTLGQGSAGAVIVEADGAVSLANDSVIFNNVEAGAGRNPASGVIDITAQSLSLTNGSQLQTLARNVPNGSAGTIKINARDTVTISGFGNPAFGNQGVALPSAIFSTVDNNVTGDAGDIQISAKSIILSDSGRVDTNLYGVGKPGSIFLKATDSISLTNGANIQTIIGKEATATTGTYSYSNYIPGLLPKTGNTPTSTILLLTGTLSLKDNAYIDASTYGKGDAGAVIVGADGKVSLTNGGRIYSEVESTGTGSAGGILMAVNSLSIEGTPDNPSGLTTSALGAGNPGVILVFADKDITIKGGADDDIPIQDNQRSGIFSKVGPGSTNTGELNGGILLTGRSIFIKDGATVNVDNDGTGVAGDLVVLARDLILNNQGKVTAVSASGEGGKIDLSLEDFFLLLRNSETSTQAGSLQRPASIKGGDITINTRYVITAPFSSNDLDAQAFGGAGGRIEVTANRLYDIEERPLSNLSNDISATSGYGPAGQVSSTVLNLDPTQGLSNLPADTVDPTRLIAETCAPRGGITERKKNQFIVTNRGGLPPDPNAAFPGEAVVTDQGTPNQQNNQPNSPHSTNPASSLPFATASPQQQQNQPDNPGSTNSTSATQTATASPQSPENQPDNPSSTNSTGATPTAIASPQPPIVEAQGWVYEKNGDIKFTNEAPIGTPTHSQLIPASTCNGLSTQP